MRLAGHPTTAEGDKARTVERTAKLVDRIGELQELLYAEHERKVLIILQGMDTSGKDGTVRKVLRETSPQGVRVVSFKKPSEVELDHDYLWRVHAQVPGRGELVVFNRSHYEDVLVVRVHSLVPKIVWKKRYDHINAFERMLADEGTTILKFFLHISREEQRERLQARLDDPTKRWKFEHGDLAERRLWDDYMRAYEEVLEKTSTDWAPWTIVPADRKFMRDFLVAGAVVKALEKLKMQYPDPPDVEGVIVE
ncbi:MAG TPA: PPK2 family polyphosphate kinase [Thermoanaerobaculia bacterium]